MSEQKKTPVVAIALSIICVLLGAGFVGTLALYLPTQDEISQKQQTIQTLTQQIAALQQELATAPDATVYQSVINQLESQVATLNSTLAAYMSEYGDLPDIIGLNMHSTAYSNTADLEAEGSVTVVEASLSYAGYLTVEATSNSSTTYAQVSYTFRDCELSFNHTLGEDGAWLFPVLPAHITMIIGTLEPENGTQVEAVVTYYY